MTTGRRRGGGPRSRSTGPRTAPTGTAGRAGAGAAGTGAAGHPAAPSPGLRVVPEPTASPAGPPTTPIERPAAIDLPLGLVGEDEILAAARARAAERGLPAPGPATVAVWSFLAAATGARTAVELGTGAGVGAVALLRGMPDDGLLTSIDVNAETHRLARTASAEAGFAPGRLRLINGRPGDVLPRLSDAGYDLVVIESAARTSTAEYPSLLAASLRLLRPGGVVALDRALAAATPGGAGTTDPVRRDAATSAQREVLRLIRDDDRLTPLVLPLGDGVLCAARR